MSDNSTGKKSLEPQYVSNEEINKHIEQWAGDGKTIVFVGAYTHCKDNIKEKDENSSSSGSGSSDSASSSAAVVAADEQGKFDLDQVKNGMYISAKPMSKEKATQKDAKEGKDGREERNRRSRKIVINLVIIIEVNNQIKST